MSSYSWLEKKFNLEPEEAAVYEWQYRFVGDFMSGLWSAIRRADEGNLDRLSMGFPVEVSAYRKFSRVDGWWEAVEKKVEQHSRKISG